MTENFPDDLLKKRKLINKDFFWQLIWKSLAWLIFGLSLAFLGGFLGKKNYISDDILANVFKKITGKTIDFQKFFLGDNLTDRRNLLLFALVFLAVISSFSTIVTLINVFFVRNDKYLIENNKFYLYNRVIFVLNSLIRMGSYAVLVLSFVSFQTFVLALFFVLTYSWFHIKKLIGNPQTENFFVWQDPHVRRIFFSSSIIIFFLPFIHYRVESFVKNINDPTKPGSLGELIRQLFASAPFLQPLWQLILNISSFAHWIILFISLRAVIFSRISEFNEFGNNLNKTIKQKTDFKHFYYYQQMLSEVNSQDITNQTKKIIILGEYNFLQIVPNFLKKECLIKHKNLPKKQQNFDLLKEKEAVANDYRKTFESFTEKIERVIDFIDLTQNHLNPANGNNYQQKKIDFIIFCLFQEYQSFAELERNEKIILSIK